MLGPRFILYEEPESGSLGRTFGKKQIREEETDGKQQPEVGETEETDQHAHKGDIAAVQHKQGTIHICMADEAAAEHWRDINAKGENDIELDVRSKREEWILKEKW